MSTRQRIALLMGQELSFCRDVVRGVRAYALGKPDWAFRNGPADARIVPYLREWKPDGIIALLLTQEFAGALRRMGTPLVDTAYWLRDSKVPVVDVDHTAVGRLAAEYLLSLGLSQFGFFGNARAEYSRLREQGFYQRLAQAGCTGKSCHGEYLDREPSTVGWRKTEPRTRQWLEELPKPVGLFVCNDFSARYLADLCSQLGLDIPGEVALLGVDNDDLECLLTSPPLSSIAIPGERIGYEAARLLDQLMAGRRAPVGRLLLPPVRVVSRQSSDTLAIRDPVILSAMRHIRAHATNGDNVVSVVQAVGVGRRELERKFRALLGRSVLDEIRRARIQQAQKLLASTDLPMPAIAKQSGFSGANRMAMVFHQVCGMSPTAYRRQSRIREA